MNKVPEVLQYQEFLKSKNIIIPSVGINVPDSDINKSLFTFQRDIVIWALKKGRAAIFAGCGLGKTPIQLECASHIEGDVLILAPLAVSQQTIREGRKFGIDVHSCRQQADVRPGINITNYEMLHKFEPELFTGVILDESSILKALDGKLKSSIIESFRDTPYKLACTATPAPNDYMELGNHAEFLGVMTRAEMLSMFFTHDGGDTSKWRLKGHARHKFWQWVSSWAVMLEKPSDLGYEDDGFILPPLNIQQVTVKVDKPIEDSLFVVEARTLDEQRKAKRSSLTERVKACAKIANSLNEPCIIWCYLNDESEMLAKMIDGAIEVRGSHSPDYKEKALLDFSEGRSQKLVSKPSIAGWGMNWQRCSKQIFCGVDHSFELWYQAIRRCWRFGQANPVDVYVVVSDAEGAIVENIKRKEMEFKSMLSGMIAATQEITSANIKGTTRDVVEYESDVGMMDDWTLYLGDCVDIMRKIPNDTIGFSIFSPPYSQLYTYSNSERDLGNSRTEEEFFIHFNFVVRELLRVIQPGRIVAVDCMNLPAMKERDGYIGLKDFRGDIIKLFIKNGFIFHSEHCIWKDPLIEATRTKSLGLMHKQLCKDSSRCRAGIPQYLLAFRKPGENQNPIIHPNGLDVFSGEDGPTKGVLSHERWRRYASPVWMDIRMNNTLNYTAARSSEDERHICPMSMDIIERGMWLWSKKGDLVLDPFNGVGSSGYTALTMGRKYIGIELKKSYWEQSIKNLQRAKSETEQPTLFDIVLE